MLSLLPLSDCGSGFIRFAVPELGFGTRKTRRVSVWKKQFHYKAAVHSLNTLLRIYSSAAVAYPLRGLMHCVFRDSCVVICITHYRPVSFNQSGPSPLTTLISNTFLPAEHNAHSMFFCFFSHHSLQTWDCCENPRRSAVSEILKEPCLSGTVKVTSIHFFPILRFGLKNCWTSWPHLHAFVHLVAATWLAD